MKQRSGFVSNSSSASFVLQKKHLSQNQIDAIYNHIQYATQHKIECGKIEGFHHSERDRWNITEIATEIRGWTSMDNFFFDSFLRAIGIAENDFQYNGDEAW